MPAIVPATNLQISVNEIAGALGNSVKNMGGFRGFGGSVPASGPISMSQCQKIKYGVGYYDTWRVPSGGVDQGEWSSTSITNRGSMTYIVWLASNAASYWRNLYHITGVSPVDNVRRPATWIFSNDTGFHCKIDTTLANDGIEQTTARIVHNGSVYMLAITINGTTQTAYLNTGAGQAFTLAGAPNNSLSTDRVYSPDTFYAATGNYALNRLWFFPYPMTSTQITNYYNSLSGTIGTPVFPLYSMTFPFTFTNMGQQGATGPSSITYGTSNPGYNTAYAMVLGTGTSAGMQRWTVPWTRNYSFTIAGAGRNYTNLTLSNPFNVNYSAYGAVGVATLSLTAGHVLRILVGQQGTQGQASLFSRCGGGGGTFIYNETTSTLLLVAGGGGGHGGDNSGATIGAGTAANPYTNGTGKGDNGQTGTAGSAGRNGGAGAGGTGGGGGGANTQGYGGDGGAGYSGNGLVNTANGNVVTPAKSFLTGGTGAIGGNSPGGFGGGGSGGNNGGAGAGGAGGYSGGGGGANQGNGEGGGGGGSYTVGTWTSISATANLGMGYVTVNYG